MPSLLFRIWNNSLDSIVFIPRWQHGIYSPAWFIPRHACSRLGNMDAHHRGMLPASLGHPPDTRSPSSDGLPVLELIRVKSIRVASQ